MSEPRPIVALGFSREAEAVLERLQRCCGIDHLRLPGGPRWLRHRLGLAAWQR